MAGSRAIWRARHDVADALLGSAALRAAARVGGYDVWDLIAPELQGIATLQFPWSARAMDEAGAAMDLARPRLVLTYAEAGGWGRAIMLEARRRGIASRRHPARLHLPALAELPARARRDGAVARRCRTIAASRAPT